jgi:hypothetical protein
MSHRGGNQSAFFRSSVEEYRMVERGGNFGAKAAGSSCPICPTCGAELHLLTGIVTLLDTGTLFRCPCCKGHWHPDELVAAGLGNAQSAQRGYPPGLTIRQQREPKRPRRVGWLDAFATFMRRTLRPANEPP